MLTIEMDADSDFNVLVTMSPKMWYVYHPETTSILLFKGTNLNILYGMFCNWKRLNENNH